MADLYNYYTGKMGGIHELILKLYKDCSIDLQTMDKISKHADELIEKIKEERKKFD